MTDMDAIRAACGGDSPEAILAELDRRGERAELLSDAIVQAVLQLEYLQACGPERGTTATAIARLREYIAEGW